MVNNNIDMMFPPPLGRKISRRGGHLHRILSCIPSELPPGPPGLLESGQASAGSGQVSAGSGQFSAGSGQVSAGSSQFSKTPHLDTGLSVCNLER